MSKNEDSQKGPDSKAPSAFEKLAAEIARRDLLSEDVTYLPHNSRLYTVEKNWKSFTIKNDPKVAKVETLSEFERALRDQGIHMIYIPVSALISIEGIHRVCQRNAVAKTVFKEVEDD